jgi:hypothetical protein
MMRTIRLIGLTAFALCAFAAMAASASASLPEFLGGGTGICELLASAPPPPYRGPYPNEELCLGYMQRGSGDWYELVTGFTSTSEADHLVAGSNKVNCTKDTDEGYIGSKKTIEEVLVAFTGCKLELLSIACSSKGAKTEEIMTAKLKGTLGYINKSTKLVGIKLEPESGSEFTAGEIECLGTKVKVTGGLIADAKPVNTKTTTGTLEFKASGSKQADELIEIEGKDETGIKLKASVNGEPAIEASEETTDSLSFTKEVELMA